MSAGASQWDGQPQRAIQGIRDAQKALAPDSLQTTHLIGRDAPEPLENALVIRYELLVLLVAVSDHPLEQAIADLDSLRRELVLGLVRAHLKFEVGRRFELVSRWVQVRFVRLKCRVGHGQV